MKCLLVCVLAAAAFGVVLSLPFKRYDTSTTKHNVLRTARDVGATKFANFVHKSGLQGNYTKKAGNFTLFVPDNAAFKNLCKNIKHNMTLMRQLLLFHSVKGTYDSFDLTQGKNLTTLSGRHLFINVTETGAILVNGINVTKSDIWAKNGVIFLVDSVILTGSGVNCTHQGNHTHHNMTTHLCPNGTSGVNCSHHGNHTFNLHPHRCFGLNCSHYGNHSHHNMTVHGCHNGTFGVNCSHHGNHTLNLLPHRCFGLNCSHHGNHSHHNMTVHGCHNGTSGVNCSHHGNHTFNLHPHRCFGLNCSHHGNHSHHNMTVHGCHNGTFGVNCSHHGNHALNLHPHHCFGLNCSHHGNHSHHNTTVHGCHNGTSSVNCSHHGNHTLNLHPHHCFGLNCSHHGNHSHGNTTKGTIHHYLTQHYQQFSNLIYDLLKTGVWADLDTDHVTLLAPTNHAFDAMGKMFAANLNHMPLLKATMKFHVLKGKQPPSRLHQGQFLTSIDGHRMHVVMTNGHVSHFNKVEIANVIHADNGIIYVMKGVLHAPQHVQPV